MSQNFLNENIKVDLHIHSVMSEYKELATKEDGTSIVSASTIANVEKFLVKVDSQGINLIAFSDHNVFNKELFLKAKDIIENSQKLNNLKGILPSVEFDVQVEKDMGKCHILVVFDYKKEEDLKKLEDILNPVPHSDKNFFYELNVLEDKLREIGLSTVLIACQRKTLGNSEKKKGANSISDSVHDIYSFLKTGYITALEYQNNHVQGILKRNLEDVPNNIALVCGSDCHEWEYYPLHDKNDKAKNQRFFEIKAQPTFMGLTMALTSPKTRFNRISENTGLIKSICMNGKEIPLSSGFNAIIGENGSGKSTILCGVASKDIKDFRKSLLKGNEFKTNPSTINDSQIKLIEQSELVNNSAKESGIFGSENLFKEIDNKEFAEEINNLSQQIMAYLDDNIRLSQSREKVSTLNIELDPKLLKYNSHFVQILFPQKTIPENDEIESRFGRLNDILWLIRKEYAQDFYDKRQKEILRIAFEKLSVVREEVKGKYILKKISNKIEGLFRQAIDSYNAKLENFKTTDEENASKYKKSRSKFISSIKDFVANKILVNSHKKPDTKPISNGVESFEKNGYKFVTEAKYNKSGDHQINFYKSVFNAGYDSYEKIMKIDSTDELIKSISHVQNGEYRIKYRNLTKQFIEEYSRQEKYVLETTTDNRIGSTLGEQSLVFYKYVSDPDYSSNLRLMLIDQPEDNISNSRIANNLLAYLGKLRNQTQLVIVTHNPLLVVNLDVDNVICLENDPSDYKKISVSKSGCLEQEGILGFIAEKMDGGVAAIEKRLKIYAN